MGLHRRKGLFDGLTWTCHFCGATRADADIAVAETERYIGLVPVKLTRRYCRDRPECLEKAAEWRVKADEFGNVKS